MIDAPQRCVARTFAALALGGALSFPVHAAKVVLPLADLEPQYGSELCWAAADVIAVNSFYTTSCATNSASGRTNQGREAAYGILPVTKFHPLASYPPAAVASIVTNCEGQLQECNLSGTPILPGLTFQQTANGIALSWAQAKQQIDAGHPFLFQWTYPSGGGTSKPQGLHELVAVGYSDEPGKSQLIIWDPWPVPSSLPQTVPDCTTPAPTVSATTRAAHTATIDFSTYAYPESEMGVGAAHVMDQYDLALVAPVIPEPPSNLQVDAVPIPLPPHKKKPKHKLAAIGVDFGVALKAALPDNIRGTVLQDLGYQNATVGTPFPVIGLGLEAFRLPDAKAPALLMRKTSAVLFPIESNGEVVGAFLMLLGNGSWHRGGYANTEITRLLVKVRGEYATKHALSLESFYVVSVPGRAAFFAAYGVGSHAVLIPASSDPSIGATAADPVPAEQQLRLITAAINREDAMTAKTTMSQSRLP